MWYEGPFPSPAAGQCSSTAVPPVGTANKKPKSPSPPQQPSSIPHQPQKKTPPSASSHHRRLRSATISGTSFYHPPPSSAAAAAAAASPNNKKPIIKDRRYFLNHMGSSVFDRRSNNSIPHNHQHTNGEDNHQHDGTTTTTTKTISFTGEDDDSVSSPIRPKQQQRQQQWGSKSRRRSFSVGSIDDIGIAAATRQKQQQQENNNDYNNGMISSMMTSPSQSPPPTTTTVDSNSNAQTMKYPLKALAEFVMEQLPPSPSSREIVPPPPIQEINLQNKLPHRNNGSIMRKTDSERSVLTSEGSTDGGHSDGGLVVAAAAGGEGKGGDRLKENEEEEAAMIIPSYNDNNNDDSDGDMDIFVHARENNAAAAMAHQRGSGAGWSVVRRAVRLHPTREGSEDDVDDDQEREEELEESEGYDEKKDANSHHHHYRPKQQQQQQYHTKGIMIQPSPSPPQSDSSAHLPTQPIIKTHEDAMANAILGRWRMGVMNDRQRHHRLNGPLSSDEEREEEVITNDDDDDEFFSFPISPGPRRASPTGGGTLPHQLRRYDSDPTSFSDAARGASNLLRKAQRRGSISSTTHTALRTAAFKIANIEGTDPDYAGFTGLRKLCNVPMLDGRADAQWYRVREYLQSLTCEEARIAAETREGEGDETALHLACRQKPPVDVVRMLLQASTEPAGWTESNHGWLPLHYECHNGVNAEVARLLVEAFPDGLITTDHYGRTPLHIATSNDVAPPSFAALRILMCPENLAMKSSATTLNTSTDPMRTTQEKHHHQSNTRDGTAKKSSTRRRLPSKVPITIQYLSDRAEKILEHDYEERQCAVQCLDVFLDARLDACARPSQRETSNFIATLEDACPSWFRERASVHPYVQALLNWQIVQHFPTAVLTLDFYVLVVLIIFFRMASYQSLDIRAVYRATMEEERAFNESTTGANSGGTYVYGLIVFGGNWIGKEYVLEARDDEVDLVVGTGEASSSSSSLGLGLYGPLLPIYMGAFYLLSREVLQMISYATRGLFHAWVFDIWNYLDVMCIALLLRTCSFLHSGEGGDESVRLLVVVTSGVLWMMMLSFLKLTRRNFAVFVSGVLHVTLTLSSFLITLGIFLVAFAQMYFTDFQGTERCMANIARGATSTSFSPAAAISEGSSLSKYIEHDFCTAYGSYLKVYMMLVGGGVDVDDFTYDSTALWLSIYFAFMVTILLVNVLIAIVTDSYQEVKCHGEAVFWSHRMSFVFEVDQIRDLFVDLLPAPFRQRPTTGQENDKNEHHRGKIVDDGSLSTHASSVMNHTRHRVSFMDKLRDLWDIVMIAYEDPANFGIWRKKTELKHRWKGPKWLLGEVVNPVVYPDAAVPSVGRRLVFTLLIALWLLAGVLSAGLLFPPQVRKYLLCPAISENDDGKKPATSDEVSTLRDEIRDEIVKMESTVDARLDEMRRETNQIKDVLDEVKTNMRSMQQMLTAILELETARAREAQTRTESPTANGDNSR